MLHVVYHLSIIHFTLLIQTQHHKLSTYNDLEKENKKLKEEAKHLRDEIHNKLLLEEEVHDLKGRLVNYKEHEKKLATLQVNTLREFMRHYYK